MPRPERTFRTPAIILRRNDFGEADRLLTLLTPYHGKRDALAKGVRKPTATKTGHVELFTRADMLISRGRNIDIVVQAEMTKPFLEIREDLQRGAYASYCAELVDKFVPQDDENIGEAFNLLDETLQRLCTENDIRLVTRYYEIHLLDAVGFRPELQHCVYTRQEIQPEDQFFSYEEGGVVNPLAGQNADGVTPISLVALKMLRHIQRSPFALVKTVQITPKLHMELERIMQGYITFLLERKLQSVDFIRRLRR